MPRPLHSLTPPEIARICREAFGLDVEVGAFMAGEIAVNIRVSAHGKPYVLKAEYPSPDMTAAHIDWVSGVQEHARRAGLPVAAQVPVVGAAAGASGFVALVPIAAEAAAAEAPTPALVRLQTFLSGSVATEAPAGLDLPGAFGSLAAQLVRALADVPREPVPVLHPWSFETTGANVLFACDRIASLEAAGMVPGEESARTSADLALARSIAREFEDVVRPGLDTLPHQVLHQDLNDFNVLVEGGADGAVGGGRVSGIIDFGDARFAPRVAEIALAAGYATLGTEDPVGSLARAVDAYDEVMAGTDVIPGTALALTDAERDIIPLAALARLCLNACQWTARTLTTSTEDPRHGYGKARMQRTWPVIRALAAATGRA